MGVPHHIIHKVFKEVVSGEITLKEAIKQAVSLKMEARCRGAILAYVEAQVLGFLL